MSSAVLFRVGAVEYAARGRMVRSLPAPSPRPATIDHLGAAVPLLDLPCLFGVPTGKAEPLILLVQEDGRNLALVIEELVGVASFYPEDLQPVPDVYPAAERRRWAGVLLRPGGGLAVVLRTGELAAAAGADR
jgi:chemotaxis signal transduction protein